MIDKMSMHYLIYVSVAREHFTSEALLLLLDQAQRFNTAHDITGMLLYKGGNFMQLLEGPEAEITPLYEKILMDPRHDYVTLIVYEPCAQRGFAQWSMGFQDMDKLTSAPRFDKYIDTQLTSENFNGKPQLAREFIQVFNKLNY